MITQPEPAVIPSSASSPLEIPHRCIAAGSPPGGRVLDLFSGASTTGVAARQLGRSYVGVDINPEFHAIGVHRLGLTSIRRIRETLMNLPQRDEALIAEAGVTLDRALFPLLVGIQRFGPLGVGELADRAGRDYSTVSRQVAKLAELGLIDRRPSPTDRRVNEAVISSAGRRVTDALDAGWFALVLADFASGFSHGRFIFFGCDPSKVARSVGDGGSSAGGLSEDPLLA